MNVIAQQLLDAQIQHELARYAPRQLKKTLRQESATLLTWLSHCKLRDVLPADVVAALITRIVVELPISDGLAAFVRRVAEQILHALKRDPGRVQDLCTRRIFEAAVGQLGGMHKARSRLIHQLVNSGVYSEQISELLYNGIKDYLLSENLLAQKVPGLASLIRLGKFAVNKTLHPLELAIEKTVKAYIETNLGNSIRRSETLINAYFEKHPMDDMAARVWPKLASIPISKYATLLEGDDLDRMVTIGLDFWQHFRKSALFRDASQHVVQQIYDRYGDLELSFVFAELGLTEKFLQTELTQLLAPSVELARRSGELEQQIRVRLTSFYEGAEVARILDAVAAPPATAKPKAQRKSARKPAQP